MKTVEVVVLRFLQVLSICLGIIVKVAISYAVIQIAVGNVYSTAIFDF